MVEQGTGIRSPLIQRGQGEVVLGLEVVEEAALGDASRGADVRDARRGLALGAHDLDRGVE
jgi:hypothetical protein